MLQQNNAPFDGATARRYARIGGFLYLIIIVIGLLGETAVRGSLVVHHDPVATAARILDAQWLWRLGVGGQLVLLICAVALTQVWYLLLRPVSRPLALLLVFFALISLAVESVSALCLQAVLLPLSGADFLAGMSAPQLQSLAFMAIDLHADAFGLALIFFGVECLVVGQLIRKATYFPTAIGVLMQLAGAAYLINSFCLFLVPSVARLIFPAILLPAFVGECAFCLWLLFKGIDVAAWDRGLGDAAHPSTR